MPQTKIIGYTLRIDAKVKDLELVNKIYNYATKLVGKEHRKNIRKHIDNAFDTIRITITNVVDIGDKQ